MISNICEFCANLSPQKMSTYKTWHICKLILQVKACQKAVYKQYIWQYFFQKRSMTALNCAVYSSTYRQTTNTHTKCPKVIPCLGPERIIQTSCNYAYNVTKRTDRQTDRLQTNTQNAPKVARWLRCKMQYIAVYFRTGSIC